ncbi:MAG: toll/interleukin-1 receptor domain-containing protein, partial [Verrucomicrobiota bacterium]
RTQRKVFISYRRDDATGVANQLFEQLSHRGYWVFLDTASIDSGVDFQDALWARMADVDLLVFLDTPRALSSRWVYQELARAHNLGLGVLQLVWPGHSRTRGTELCDVIELQNSDFEDSRPERLSRLLPACIDRAAERAEKARIISLGKKRSRIVSDMVDKVEEAGLDAAVNPVGPITIFRNRMEVGAAIPFVGVPDAPSIQQQERGLRPEELKRYRGIYNGLGIDPEWSDHLGWLNEHHNLRTEQVDQIEDWLKTL